MTFQLQLQDAVEKKLRFINENRERFIEAFIAETGYLPSEVVMVQKDEGGGTARIWFERKTAADDLYRKETE
jgi:hypothetical protein